jgi:hypothetical protein
MQLTRWEIQILQPHRLRDLVWWGASLNDLIRMTGMKKSAIESRLKEYKIKSVKHLDWN